MTSDELRKTLTNHGNRTSDEIDMIVAKFEKSIENRKISNIQYKSTRSKIQEFIKDNELNQKDCRFFWWHPGIGIFVHRDVENKKATVSYSFLNRNDFNDPDFKYDIRNGNYYALLNWKLNKYTYEVEWRGRSEFAVYDTFIKYHNDFPLCYRDLMIGIGIFKPKFN